MFLLSVKANQRLTGRSQNALLVGSDSIFFYIWNLNKLASYGNVSVDSRVICAGHRLPMDSSQQQG